METVNKLMSNKVLLAVVAVIFAAIYALQEKNLGTPKINVVIFSVIFGIVCGAFCEFARMLTQHEKYDWTNILSWVIGAIVGAIAIFIA